MSNFDFLKDYDRDLYNLGNLIEENIRVSPASITTYATPFLERVLVLLMEETGRAYNSRKTFYHQLDGVCREGVISRGFKQRIYDAYLLRNRIHGTADEMISTQIPVAIQLHSKLFYIAKKLYRDFNENYDDYKGVPDFKPVEIDTSTKELDLIEIPDFSQIIDTNYDYCVICGEPNHSNYSLCCYKCNRVMDNANNFVSIRNDFGSDATFTNEDLIDYGIPEGYVNQLVSSLVRDNMLKVKGRFISFNNIGLEGYLSKIDEYISVCELITKFREDEIKPADIKKTSQYRQGSHKQEPFYNFYKIINHEVINKFERDLLTTENIHESIQYTTIPQNDLKRWYIKNKNNYSKGIENESFVVFNRLLIGEYLSMKREGMMESEIRQALNVNSETYEFFSKFDETFTQQIKDIQLDLIIRAINDGKTKSEIIEFAGITPKEYENIVKVSQHHGDDFSKLRNREIESRKSKFLEYLEDNDLRTSCELAKFSLDDFYYYFESSNHESEFYTKTTKLLMEKYLEQRRLSNSVEESLEITAIDEKYLNRWLSRTKYKDFKNRDIEVSVGLILDGFKDNKSLEEISEISGIKAERINTFIKLGEKGSTLYRPLFEYYESEIIPQKISKFLDGSDTKSIKKALESSKLSAEELDKYYQLGKSGDERFLDLYERFSDIKKATYIHLIVKGKTQKIAMKESFLTNEEFEEYEGELNDLTREYRMQIVLETVKNNKSSNVAANKANCSVDEIYEWYFKGKEGDEDYELFYEVFHGLYVRPNVNSIVECLEFKNKNLDNIIKNNKDQFTKKDLGIWADHGLIEINKLNLKNDEGEEKEDSNFNANEMLRQMGVEDYDKVKIAKSSNSSSILNKDEEDIEKLKKEILKK